jgi:hypothetical protein
LFGQTDSLVSSDTNTYKVVKTDGGEFIGKILTNDAREVLLLTLDNRKIYIPQHTIKEIIKIKADDFNVKGQYVGEDKFATRYFLTTNGLPIKKGENYVQWNLFGPDFQFAVGDDFGVGVMTSWVGIPIIGTIKKSWEISETSQFAVGGLVGTGSWVAPEFGGALPFATLSFGNRKKNIAFSGGYGAIWDDRDVQGRAIGSIAGMVKISPKLSFVFDSFVLLPGKDEVYTYTYDRYNNTTMQYEPYTRTYTYERPGLAMVIPGIRWHQKEGQSLQFGFTGVMEVSPSYLIPVPLPMVQWYRTL